MEPRQEFLDACRAAAERLAEHEAARLAGDRPAALWTPEALAAAAERATSLGFGVIPNAAPGEVIVAASGRHHHDSSQNNNTLIGITNYGRVVSTQCGPNRPCNLVICSEPAGPIKLLAPRQVGLVSAYCNSVIEAFACPSLFEGHLKLLGLENFHDQGNNGIDNLMGHFKEKYCRTESKEMISLLRWFGMDHDALYEYIQRGFQSAPKRGYGENPGSHRRRIIWAKYLGYHNWYYLNNTAEYHLSLKEVLTPAVLKFVADLTEPRGDALVQAAVEEHQCAIAELRNAQQDAQRAEREARSAAERAAQAHAQGTDRLVAKEASLDSERSALENERSELKVLRKQVKAQEVQLSERAQRLQTRERAVDFRETLQGARARCRDMAERLQQAADLLDVDPAAVRGLAAELLQLARSN